jgi:secreted trypsin-like serine protease
MRNSTITVFKAMGWGMTQNDIKTSKASDILMETDMMMVNQTQCRDYVNLFYETTGKLRQFNVDNAICTHAINRESGPCKGDSGGPLFFESPDGDTLVGTVSFGPRDKKCVHVARDIYGAEYLVPEVYTRISQYHPWITQQLTQWAKAI